MSNIYEDPAILINRRLGTQDSPFVNINETLMINADGKAILSEIPDAYNRLKVTGDNKQWYEIEEGIPDVNQYKVDYNNKIVTFNIANVGKQLNFEYLGTGNHYYSMSSIYVEQKDGNVLTTLQDKVDDFNQQYAEAIALDNQLHANEDQRANNENERINAENQRISNENTRQENESTRQANENTRVTNEINRQTNEDTRVNNENERIAHENTRENNENIRQTNETDRINSENVRKTNETTRENSENIRVSNENNRMTNEDTRQTNENNRINNENIRQTNEDTRQTNESTRIENENVRQSNESARQTNESSRQTNEDARITNENERQTNESQRISNENTRQTNEDIRQQQEAQRQTDTANAIANAQQATIDANNAANNANDKANLADQKATLAQEKVDSLSTLETQLNQTISDSQTATENANTSASNANDKATYAQQQGDYAKAQGDYAKQQGDAANLAVTNVNEAITNANSAITNANEAANNANSAANNAQTVVDNTKFIEPYNPETTYQKNNIVSYNGSSFIAKQTTTGNTPIGDANDVYWGLLAQRGVDGQGAVNSVNNILPDVNGNINITATDVGSIPISQKGVPNGVASIDENGRVLDGNGNVVEGKVTSVNGHIGDVNLNANDVGAISASEKGVANGVALLNADGKVVDSNGNLVEGKVTSVNGQIGDVNITAADVGAETPDEAQAKADTAEQNAKNYTDQQISGKVSTQAVMLRNTTTITTVESSAPVEIADYNPSTDFLLVVKNSVVLTEGEEYTIDTANKAIVNTQGSWDGTANPINFLFIVYKNVAGSIDYYDGELLLDGTVTDSKLASDNKIGSLAELTTTDKTSVVNAINENKQQIDLHADDTTIHITSAERTAWNNAESNAKAYTDTAPEAMQRNFGQFLTYRSGKDSNGVFTTVDYKRSNGTLFARSVLSNADTNGNYQTRIITYYATDGTTVVRTDTWTLTYDADGDLVNEVKA